MKILLAILFLAINYSHVFSQEMDYSATNIPQELKDNEIAVIRNNRIVLTKTSINQAKLEAKTAITILNENGVDQGKLVVPYNKFIKVGRIKATLYDKDGKKVRKLDIDEIEDYSNVSSYSLYEDNRVKYCELLYNAYPYTVEYEYDISYKGFFQYPTWYIQSSYNLSVQNASYTLILPEGEEFSQKSCNIELVQKKTKEKENDVYTWEVKNLNSFKSEPFTHNYVEILPSLYLSPIEFEYGGVTGNFSSWASFGDWVNELNQNKTNFLPETEQEIIKIIQSCQNDREKVDVIYKYMQDKVRYVNITIGIGGYEPIEAQRVHEVSYGDCKALSNYMKAMLEVVGIKSVYTLVYAGNSPKTLLNDFVSPQFNHAILMVPLEQDSIWLECTSQRLPCGFLGDFTDDREVLFITEQGGKLGRTPSYPGKTNLICTSAKIKLDSRLNAEISRSKKYEGIRFDNKYSSLLNQDKTMQERSLKNSYRLSVFSLDTFYYHTELDDSPRISEYSHVSDDAFANYSGEYLLIPINSVSSEIEVPKRIRNRKFDIHFHRAYKNIDTIDFFLPENLEVIELPESVNLESPFGRYAYSITQDDKKIMFIRQIEFHKGEFPANQYSKLYNFYKAMNIADKKNIMLKKL